MSSPTYSAADLITIIGAIGLLVAAVGAQLVNIINAFRTNTTLKEMKTATDVIGVHVNGAAAAAVATITALEDKVRMLRELLADKKLDAALLAQAAATAAVVAPIAATVDLVPKKEPS